MIAALFYFIGIILCIKAIIEIINMPINPAGKVITIIIMALLSWFGLALYYLVARDNMTRWFR